jgi:phospho-N-acetylmuramoyl-pentapeptide-transferase
MELINLIKVLVPAVIAFISGIAITPFITKQLYTHKAWKKKAGKLTLEGTDAIEFNKLHKAREREVPRMGGVVIWGSAFITIIGLWLIALVLPTTETIKLDFLSRSQTWIPLLALGIGALVGLVNDILDIYYEGNGLSLKRRLAVVVVMSVFIGWWFYDKLEITSIGIPFTQPLEIGWLIIPFFVLVTLALYASGIIDGVDGLAGGVFATIFAAYSVIALTQDQIDLAAFSAMLVGAILAFLWFNIPPARFFMTETGTMALTLTLATIAFMTDTLGEGIGIAVLPVIGFLLVATVSSTLIQEFSKRFLGKKIFRIAPLHHHFEARGWSGPKVTMRYWILGAVFAFFGVLLALIG